MRTKIEQYLKITDQNCPTTEPKMQLSIIVYYILLLFNFLIIFIIILICTPKRFPLSERGIQNKKGYPQNNNESMGKCPI